MSLCVRGFCFLIRSFSSLLILFLAFFLSFYGDWLVLV